MKKRFIGVILSVVMVFSVTSAAMASVGGIGISDGNEVSTRAEVQKWYYRIYNGAPQKRLWSETRGVWLTNWMPA